MPSWSEWGSDPGVRPVRPQTGWRVLVPEEPAWEASQTGSVVELLTLFDLGVLLTVSLRSPERVSLAQRDELYY